jgi:hypothetical protein
MVSVLKVKFLLLILMGNLLLKIISFMGRKKVLFSEFFLLFLLKILNIYLIFNKFYVTKIIYIYIHIIKH